MHVQAEEERVNGQYQALQAAFPVVAIGAGALGALAGGSKHFLIFHDSPVFQKSSYVVLSARRLQV